jgi:polar amino acid transport system permease protein
VFDKSFGLSDVFFLLRAAGVTILLVSAGMSLGTIIGFLFGIVGSCSRNQVWKYLVAGYVEFFRGTPLLIQVFLIYFGLPLFGINVPAMVAAIISLTIYTGAYMTEITRGGILSVAKTQWEASASIGLTFLQQMRYVIVPQAVRIMIPPSVGFLVGLVKDSSLMAVIGFMELTRVARLISDRTMKPILVISIAGIIYFIICYPLALLGRRLEKALKGVD